MKELPDLYIICIKTRKRKQKRRYDSDIPMYHVSIEPALFFSSLERSVSICSVTAFFLFLKYNAWRRPCCWGRRPDLLSDPLAACGTQASTKRLNTAKTVHTQTWMETAKAESCLYQRTLNNEVKQPVIWDVEIIVRVWSRWFLRYRLDQLLTSRSAVGSRMAWWVC